MAKVAMGHGESGEVCNVGDDYRDPKRVRVTVKHGERPKKKKKSGKNVAMAMGDYDDRPESQFSVPREKAHHYPVGKKVRVAVHPHAKKKKAAQSDDRDYVADLYGGKAS